MREERVGDTRKWVSPNSIVKTPDSRLQAKDSLKKPKTVPPKKTAPATKETKLRRNPNDEVKKAEQTTTRSVNTRKLQAKTPTKDSIDKDADLSFDKISPKVPCVRRPRQSQRALGTSAKDDELLRALGTSAKDDELLHLKKLVQVLKEKEEKLQEELGSEKKGLDIALHKVSELEYELNAKCHLIDLLKTDIESLKAEHNAKDEHMKMTIRALETELSRLKQSKNQHKQEISDNKLYKEFQSPNSKLQSPNSKHHKEEAVDKQPSFKCLVSPTLLKAHIAELAAKCSDMKPSSAISNKFEEKKKIPYKIQEESKKFSRDPVSPLEPSSPENPSLVAPHSHAPPPPPPPPLPFSQSARFFKKNNVQKSTKVVELYQSLMKHDAKKEAKSENHFAATSHTSMIGEIENRSAHMLAVKADIETKGEMIRNLIKEVKAASFSKIEDVLKFIQWLDEKLAVLVDERAVLKHFDWPERKADVMREAALRYRDLKRLESKALANDVEFCNSGEASLKKMDILFDKVEKGTNDLISKREVEMRIYKDFQVPTDWMQDTGIVKEMKYASVRLAKKYMEKLSLELESCPELTYKTLILQGVRFAYRVHQFAGGFDEETMHVFEEVKELASSYIDEQYSPSTTTSCSLDRQSATNLYNKANYKSALSIK